MAKEETTQTMIDESVIKAAIEAVQEKGIDLNPYTVADEADCSPEEIYRAPGHMKLIAEARGMSDPEHAELMKSLDELGRERDALAEKVAGMETREPLKTGDFPTPDELSEQMKELLESETENELKQLEEELEQAYTQTAQLQEENLELTHTISGLEKVNEALNARLRELEDQLAGLKSSKPATEDSDPAGKDKLITENEALTQRVKTIESENDELVERVKVAEGENEELSETVLALQHKIISLENKLAELQQESESLAMQLQNAFHTSYEKGIQEGLKRAGAAAPPLEVKPLPETEPEEPEVLPAEVKPLPETEPEEEPETAPESGSEVAMETAQQDLAPSYQDIVHNFAQTGPYVASDFNPLEDLKWRDLETVYGMGVLSIKDFSEAVTARHESEAAAPAGPDPAAAGTEPESTEQASQEQRTTSSRIQMYEETTIFSEAGMDFTGSSDSLTPLPPEAYQSAPSPIDSPPSGSELPEDQIPDFDQLDIFEDIEELEQLGKIEVPEDLLADVPIDEVQRQKAQAAMGETPNQEPSGEELRELLRNRIKQASEQAVEQQVRTPPAPGSEEGKAASGLTKKFVGGKAQHNEQPSTSQSGMPAMRAVPPEIRKHCQILGIREEGLTREIVMEAWKKEITSPGVHPDQGGDTELAVYLNTAKDALLRFIEDSGPKLGKKFGAQSSKEMSSRFTGKKKQES